LICVHFFVLSSNPARGGMEESAQRVLQLLSPDPELHLTTYLFAAKRDPEIPSGLSATVNIGAMVDKLLSPLSRNKPTQQEIREVLAEWARLQVLLAKTAVRREMDLRPNDTHLILSFYLTSMGFVGQHVASALDIPHIACSRGSDLGRDIYLPEQIAALQFVARKATALVTPSAEHRLVAQKVLERAGAVRVVYNSLPVHIRPLWRRRQRDTVRLVTVCGYSVRKGTATLLEAVAELIDESLPVELSIIGPVGLGSWETIRRSFLERYPGRLSFRERIPKSELEAHILDADIYCSASLSEGCSNATMLALALGIPIVSSATGALVDLALNLRHVALAPPGNVGQFRDALRMMVLQIMGGTLEVSTRGVLDVVERLSPNKERDDWQAIIRGVAVGAHGSSTGKTSHD
jgi:glycosyltransferase involved in cell wall biosynthesis